MHPSTVSRGRQQKVFNYCRSSDFSEVSQSPAFVDKTLFIKSFFESKFNYCFVVAPPGYGKSTNLDMFKRFVEIDVDPQTGRVFTFKNSKNYRIFKKNNIKIYQEQQFFKNHFAKFPVIYLTLNAIYARTLELVMHNYAEILTRSFQQHHYLTKSDKLNGKERKRVATYTALKTCKKLSEDELQNGVQFLAEMLAKHYMLKEVIVLIDDFDYPCSTFYAEWIMNHESREPLVFFQKLFDSIVNPNSPIARGLFVGRTEFSTFDFEHENNVEFYTVPMCHVFYEYFGLMKNDIVDLLIRFDLNSSETVDRIINNYSLSTFNPEPTIICTSAMMQYLNKREFRDFRRLSDKFYINTFVREYIDCSLVRHLIDKLLVCSDVKITTLVDDATIQINFVMQFLKYYGYFNVKEYPDFTGFSLANDFIQDEFLPIIIDYYGNQLDDDLDACAHIFNQISINASRSVYFNFVEEFRRVTIIYSHRFPTERYASIQCMADIMSKTTFLNFNPITIEDFPFSICNTYLYDLHDTDHTTTKTKVMYLNVEYETPIQFVLATALHNLKSQDLSKYCDVNDEEFVVAISTDENFRFAIGWLVGTDLKNAQYFSFK